MDRGHLLARPREEQGRRAVRSARWPAVCERPHPHRPCVQQDPEGLRREESHAQRGYFTPYIPGWDCHGQPIEHMVETSLGTEKFRETPAARGAPPVPRVGREVRGRAARGLQAPGRERRLGAPVPHVHPELRGGQRRDLQEDVPRRRDLPRPQAHPLVQRTATPRSPRPRSSTATRSRPPSSCASR